MQEYASAAFKARCLPEFKRALFIRPKLEADIAETEAWYEERQEQGGGPRSHEISPLRCDRHALTTSTSGEENGMRFLMLLPACAAWLTPAEIRRNGRKLDVFPGGSR